MKDLCVKKSGVGQFSKGVFAKRDFKKGEIVLQYYLNSLTKDEFQNLSSREKKFVHVHRGIRYLYSIPERYVNHSSTPNTLQDLTNKCDVALRDICIGEEITTDSTKDDS